MRVCVRVCVHLELSLWTRFCALQILLLLLLLSVDSKTEHIAVLGGVRSIHVVPAHYIIKGALTASYLMPRQPQVVGWGGGGGGQ